MRLNYSLANIGVMTKWYINIQANINSTAVLATRSLLFGLLIVKLSEIPLSEEVPISSWMTLWFLLLDSNSYSIP